MKITFLQDTQKLQEIYELRVEVWERSPGSSIVNRNLFPSGWKDEMDDHAMHAVIFNKDQKIIAAARLNILNQITDLNCYKYLKHLTLPDTIPFAYYSRLVVSVAYQSKGLAKKLDNFILNECKKKEVAWVLGLASSRTNHFLKEYGFSNFGQIGIKYHMSAQFHRVNTIVKILS